MPTITSDTVSYCLRDTHTVDKNGEKCYKAQPIKAGNVVEHDQLCKKIGQMAFIPATTVEAVLQTLPEALRFFMMDLGHKVSIKGLGYFGLEVTGSCTESDRGSPFEKNFKINPYFRLAPSLRKYLLAERPPTLLDAEIPNPVRITAIIDTSESSAGNCLTRGAPLRIKGKNLRYNPEADDEGLFLIYPGGKQSYRFEGVLIQLTALITQLPNIIPPGNGYTLELRTRLRNAGKNATPTIGHYFAEITVL